MVAITPKQKELLAIAKEKGFLTTDDFVAVFSSPISRKSNIERFIAMGILTKTEDKYKLELAKLGELGL